MFGKLFSSGPTSEARASALQSIQSDFAGFLIQPSPEELAQALESWSWLKLPKTPPILVSAFGDVFFSHSGKILMLDTLEGRLVSAAQDEIELRTKLGDVELQDRYLSSVWVQAAQRAGLSLAPGECYDWKVAPVLGGQMAADEIVKLSFVVKVNIAGQLHRQVKDLPPGTKINRVTISD